MRIVSSSLAAAQYDLSFAAMGSSRFFQLATGAIESNGSSGLMERSFPVCGAEPRAAAERTLGLLDSCLLGSREANTISDATSAS